MRNTYTQPYPLIQVSNQLSIITCLSTVVLWSRHFATRNLTSTKFFYLRVPKLSCYQPFFKRSPLVLIHTSVHCTSSGGGMLDVGESDKMGLQPCTPKWDFLKGIYMGYDHRVVRIHNQVINWNSWMSPNKYLLLCELKEI